MNIQWLWGKEGKVRVIKISQGKREAGWSCVRLGGQEDRTDSFLPLLTPRFVKHSE